MENFTTVGMLICSILVALTLVIWFIISSKSFTKFLFQKRKFISSRLCLVQSGGKASSNRANFPRKFWSPPIFRAPNDCQKRWLSKIFARNMEIRRHVVLKKKKAKQKIESREMKRLSLQSRILV